MRRSFLYVRIWHLQTLDYDVSRRSPLWKGEYYLQIHYHWLKLSLINSQEYFYFYFWLAHEVNYFCLMPLGRAEFLRKPTDWPEWWWWGRSSPELAAPYHQHYTHCTLSTDDNSLSISSALYPLYIIYRWQRPFYIISIIPTVHCLQITTPFPYNQHYTHFTLSTDDTSLSI